MDSDQAQDAYNTAKRKYREASSDYSYWCKMESEYASARKSAQKTAEESNTEKINFEKWLQEVEKILKIMEGNGGWGAQNLPDDVKKAVKNSEEAAESFSACIQCSEIGSSDLNLIFRPKSVEADPDSGRALTLLRDEKKRIQDMIAGLKATISNQTALAETLRRNINSCIQNQDSCRSRMNRYSDDMDYYRSYL